MNSFETNGAHKMLTSRKEPSGGTRLEGKTTKVDQCSHRRLYYAATGLLFEPLRWKWLPNENQIEIIERRYHGHLL